MLVYHRFIGEAGSSALQHRVGQRPVAGEVEIGEDQLSPAYQLVFRFNRLLHFDNHFGYGIDLLDGREDMCPGTFVLSIWETTVFTCGMLYVYRVTSLDQFAYSGGSH